VESNRNFSTKLWNAARFCELNGCETREDFVPANVRQTVNKWIVAETAEAIRGVTQAVEDLRFNDAANVAYQFVWSRFCDWYLELVKTIFNAGDAAAAEETRATAAWVRDQILKLLHPFMPFITEELWGRTGNRGEALDSLLIRAPWPQPTVQADPEACGEVKWLIALVSGVRSVRMEANVPAAAKIALVLRGADETTRSRLERNRDAVATLARLSSVSFAEAIPRDSAQFIVGEAVAALPLGDVIDLEKERARLRKELQRAEAEIARFDAKLGNADFLARAPEDVVDEQKERRADAEALASRLRDAVAHLG
jgi:valyl-tRNA synthetase